MHTILIFFSEPKNIIALIEIFIFILLVISSGLVSGSEVAFFSLPPHIIKKIKKSDSKSDKKTIKLIEKPNNLLATILISNNFINIAIVVLATYITATLIDFGDKLWLKFLIEAIVVTFIILLFGEIIPKIYANKFNEKFASLMAIPISILQKVFYPLVEILVKSTNIVDGKVSKTSEKLSINDISYAIDITSGQSQNERKILKRIVNLNNIEAREIMSPRVDVVTIDYNSRFTEVKKILQQNEYSRIPVIKNSLDNIIGILFIKDLVKYLNEDKFFEWQKYIRPAYFVPQNKKIDDLLQEFRNKKIHLAVVSDEYGGFRGIVTLEDIIEEIVGEINDEYDMPDTFFSKIENNKYLIDGKLLLKDLQKYLNYKDDFFDTGKGDAETVAGLILEINESFPKQNQIINYKNLKFNVKKVSKRRIVKIVLEVK